MDTKHFLNPYDDYDPLKKDTVEENQISKNSPVIVEVDNLCKKYFDDLDDLDLRDGSVYTGTAGIALLKLKHRGNAKENLKDIIGLLGLKKLKGKRCTFLCGDAGPLAIGIVVYHKLGDTENCKSLIDRLIALKREAINIDSDVANEYMYGRVGYLYALLFVNERIKPPLISDTVIRETIEAVLMWGQHESTKGSHNIPLMYKWHGSYYLGAAHGLSGILYLLLKAKRYIKETDIDESIKPSIDYLPQLRFKSGNYFSSLNSDKDRHVQWCHGAPGFLFLYCEAYRAFGDNKYLLLALECGEIVWKRGLLRKGYSLCHGVAGNAYCFLDLYQTTKDVKHLYRAIKFAEWCVSYTETHEEYPPDRSSSLYEGIAGRLYLMLDLKTDALNAKFPGYQL